MFWSHLIIYVWDIEVPIENVSYYRIGFESIFQRREIHKSSFLGLEKISHSWLHEIKRRRLNKAFSYCKKSLSSALQSSKHFNLQPGAISALLSENAEFLHHVHKAPLTPALVWRGLSNYFKVFLVRKHKKFTERVQESSDGAGIKQSDPRDNGRKLPWPSHQRLQCCCATSPFRSLLWIFHDEFLKRQKPFLSGRCCSQTLPSLADFISRHSLWTFFSSSPPRSQLIMEHLSW